MMYLICLQFILQDKETGEILSCGTSISKGRRSAHVFEMGISVLKKAWRRGIATKVMQEMMKRSRELGAEILILEVVDANHGARQLYRKLGFEEEARLRKVFKTIKGVYHDEIVMVYSYQDSDDTAT